MLLAEIHGHVLETAQQDENHLTSTIFGHLRYIPPQVFWEELFAEAKGWPDESSLSRILSDRGVKITDYSSLRIYFWPYHPDFGEPDLILCFSGRDLQSLLVLIEVKLYSGKSGTGEDDQLVKYAKLLNEPHRLNTDDPLPKGALTALIYLTTRESIEEIRNSVSLVDSMPSNFLGMFRSKWQDLLVAARRAAPSALGVPRTVLQDVQHFLERRGLEYFSGFQEDPSLSVLDAQDAVFYDRALFAQRPELDFFAVQKGEWTQ